MVRRWGIGIAIVFRIVLLFIIMNLIHSFNYTVFNIGFSNIIEGKFNLHSIIMIFGGVFIIYTAMKEILHMMVLSDHEPEEDVTVSVTSSNPDIATVNTATLTFTPGNYQNTQDVIVSGGNNTISDGHQVYGINLTAENEHTELGDWTRQTAANSTKDLLGVAYGNNKYVAVGKDGTILTSSDGTTWTSRTSGTSNELY